MPKQSARDLLATAIHCVANVRALPHKFVAIPDVHVFMTPESGLANLMKESR